MGIVNQLPTASSVPIEKDKAVTSTSDDGKSVPLYDVRECMKSHCEANVGHARRVIERHDGLNNSKSKSEWFENSNTKLDNNLPKGTPNIVPTNDSRLRKVGEECIMNLKGIENDIQ